MIHVHDRIRVALSGAVLLGLGWGAWACGASPGQDRALELTSPRLYVMDCGIITMMNPENYDLRPEEITGSGDFVTPCYLVEHRSGTLIYDVGQIPDAEFPEDGSTAVAGVFASDRPLLPQLAAIGHAPEDITYLAMSHYHTDHSANANRFAGSTWIVQRAERDAMFGGEGPGLSQRANYSELKDAETILLDGEDHDVFGDGTVVIKFTPGHTPGHQSLFVDLANTGPILLAGDLYHYVEERTLDRVPGFDWNRDVTRQSRRQVEEFLLETGARLWINHDMALFDGLKISPAFYD
jgi:glyoxylase-like metal-dependent hydrolase (beta-lactamase superfamily II)